MVDAATKASVGKIPILKTKAGPRDTLLFDSGTYDSGPTIQAERFRPDTIQAGHDSGQ